MKIVICDDKTQPLGGLEEQIATLAGGADVDFKNGEVILELANQLERRRRAASMGSDDGALAWSQHLFDRADILIIDYNFIELENPGHPSCRAIA